MTAPALVLVTSGSDDPESVTLLRTLAAHMAKVRPTIPVRSAVVDGVGSVLGEVVRDLADHGSHEIVFVPLDLARAIEADKQTLAAITDVRTSYPLLRMAMSRPVGPAPELLNIVDERLRIALRQTRTVELDGLVLSLSTAGDVRGHALVSRRARQWSTHHKLPVVVAVADGTGPCVSQAIGSLRGQGRRHIAIGSIFLAETPDFAQQASLARSQGAVAVSGPVGADDRLLDLVMARYAYAAMDLLEPEGAEIDLTDVELHSEDDLIELLAHA